MALNPVRPSKPTWPDVVKPKLVTGSEMIPACVVRERLAARTSAERICAAKDLNGERVMDVNLLMSIQVE
jgi:hypothetical protein